MSDDLVAALRAILERLGALGVDYMVVGSVAALAHGRARATQDCAVVVRAGEGRLRELVRSLPPERFYASEDAAADAVRHGSMFNIIDKTTGWKIDIVPLRSRPFSRREFDRRRPVELLGMEVFVATIEDVILSKLEWSALGGGSARQLEDVQALVALGGPRLELDYLDDGARELRVEAAWSQLRPT
ncbi:MAG: hypothetical protein WKG00_10355 [Polyangiaceae bacterium]